MELIKIEKSKGGKEIVSARDLYSYLEVSERFSAWMERQFSYGFKEGIDYVGRKEFNTLANQELNDFAITLDMAKEISMIQRSEKGKQARDYFINCEKKLRGIVSISAPTNLKEALILALQQQEEIEKKDVLLLEAKPKVEFFDKVVQSKTEISIGEASKVLNLGLGQNLLFKKLREKGVIMKGRTTPYQQYIDNGWFRVVENTYPKEDGTFGVSLKTVVYQKGLDGIRKLLSK